MACSRIGRDHALRRLRLRTQTLSPSWDPAYPPRSYARIVALAAGGRATPVRRELSFDNAHQTGATDVRLISS